jgi:hypothetical protein
MYEQWQKLRCLVVKQLEKEHTYEVLIKEDNNTATLVCIEPLRNGEEVIGIFGAFQDGRYLFSMDESDLARKRRARGNAAK